jgi:hypothetical protein
MKKLIAQKLRELMGNEDEEEISSKDKKYVINSILSAIDLESMEEDDKEDIIDKLEGEEDMEGSEESSQGEEDMDFSDDMADQEIGGEEMGQEPTPPAAPMEMGEMFDDEDEFTPHRPRFRNKVGHRDMNTDDVFDGMFNESKIDKVLEKYFPAFVEDYEKVSLLNSKRFQQIIHIQKSLFLWKLYSQFPQLPSVAFSD